MTTENWKLRALLAEARTYLKQPVKGEVRERWRSTLYGDIDAALAEPSGKLKDELCDVAERQREACALAYMRHPDAGEDEMAELYAEVIRATPLVTEDEK